MVEFDSMRIKESQEHFGGGSCSINLHDVNSMRSTAMATSTGITIIILVISKLNEYKRMIRPVGDSNVFIFDIDNCLYEKKCGFLRKEEEFIENLYNDLSRGKYVPSIDEAYEEFGGKMYCKVMEKYCGIDGVELSRLRMGFDGSCYLKKNNELRDILNKIPGRRFCLTNSPSDRAKSILERIGILDCFEGIFCQEPSINTCIFKPLKGVYSFVEEVLGITRNSLGVKNVYFFDDLEKNLEAPSSMGWKCYLIDDNINDVLKEIIEEKELGVGYSNVIST
jgi:pyrimidine 5'-nucleotidase